MVCSERSLAIGLSMVLVCLCLAPGRSVAQEPLPAVLPTVLFLVEDSARMGAVWDGDSTLSTTTSRWTYTKNAIIRVMKAAPVGFTFGVALSADGAGSEGGIGFEPLAYPGMTQSSMINQLNDYVPSTNTDRRLAESYTKVLESWASLSHNTVSSWQAGPFQYSCSNLVVIVIGSDVGLNDDNPSSGFFTTAPPADVLCDDAGGLEACFHDNVAHYAYTSFSAPVAGTGAIKTHSILVDSNSSTISDATVAGNLFQGMANQGQGLYYTASSPGGIGTAIWGILNDSFSGVYSNAAVSMTPLGDKLFASYFEVQGGHPLFKGHLLAWNIDNDPTSANYGQIVAGSGASGEIWDAGQLLASRMANASENNQFESLGSWNTNLQRTGYTSRESQDFDSELLPFDAARLSAGSDLTELLVDEHPQIPLDSNQQCETLVTDYDFDCDVDYHDAQVLVDFIRGVKTAPFFSTGIPRGPWKMGDTGHSVAVAAPATLSAIATEPHFIAYKDKLASLPSMVYVSSNAGMLHAFNLDVSGHEGGEFWFYIPRSKASRDPENSSVREFDDFQIDDLMRTGQVSVNDGRIVLEHVWLDGYKSTLSGCSGPSFSASDKDGTISPDGCEWHRVVVWSGGFGARHVYALDVTNPYQPRFLWERTDNSAISALGKGRAVGSPGVSAFFDVSGTLAQKRWLAVWGSGSQGPGVSVDSAKTEYAHAAIYIHDMDSTTSRTPTDYPQQGFAVAHPALSNQDSDSFEEYVPPEYGLFGEPALTDLDGDGSVDVAFIGDSMGYVFKVKFRETNPGSPQFCTFATPDTNDDSKHMYYKPATFFSQAGELLVYYASGSPFTIYDTSNGGLYVRKDPEPFGCEPSVAAPCAATASLFNSNGFYRFTGVGEKLVGNPTVVFGRLFFATHIPGSDPCVLGDSRIYGLDVETCGGGIFDVTTDSYTVTDNLYTETSGLISEPVFSNGQMYALNIQGSGINQNSVIDNFQVTPNNVADFVYSSWRHVY
ncbi:MAG TPA: hypothetical protein DIU15_17670 [Deltaproteobacteria bacterium]|nr:hypothetical protein [Deltaproteobacteria bacterium]HCP47872.1 hypothetical protein [Deltaproteobacteria bacterium]